MLGYLTYLQRRPRARLLPRRSLYHQECSLAGPHLTTAKIGRAEIDNLAVERKYAPSPRPRHYLFAVLDAGGERAAVAYV